MKQLLLLLLIATKVGNGHAQGTVLFVNIGPVGSGLNAPVYESDGLTPLSGPQFMAELLGGTSVSTFVSVATTGFLQGSAAGYFNGDTVTMPGVGPGTAWVEVRVWNTSSGASFAQAKNSGLPNSWWESSAFTVQAGSPFQGLPGLLTGLGNSPVYLNSVPEPSIFALAGLGSALALFRCRRQNWSAVSNH